MIESIKGSWQEVVDACRATVGKPPLGREPSTEFKRKLMISEHSPIRRLIVSWRWALPSWVATHFSRHKWECFIRTQRTDRTGVDRNQLPQGTLVEFLGEANAQHLIDTSRKRLCFESAPETRKKWAELKRELRPVLPELSDVMVPNCIYRCGCPEDCACSFFDRFVEQHPDLDFLDISKRYEAYNRMFYKEGRE